MAYMYTFFLFEANFVLWTNEILGESQRESENHVEILALTARWAREREQTKLVSGMLQQ